MANSVSSSARTTSFAGSMHEPSARQRNPANSVTPRRSSAIATSSLSRVTSESATRANTRCPRASKPQLHQTGRICFQEQMSVPVAVG
jgi:hypothetical protein